MIRVFVAQLNPTVGDLKRNFEKISFFINESKKHCADIIVFPELSLAGCPPEDLLLTPEFIKASQKYLKKIIPLTKNILVLVGAPFKENTTLYNSCFVIQNEKILAIYKKLFLPNYGVFDEKRYFSSGKELFIFSNEELNFSITICEDIWVEDSSIFEENFWSQIDVLFNISASPFFAGKINLRKRLLSKISKKIQSYLIYCNLVGGQDELIFDGRSLVFSPQGQILFKAKAFEEDFICFDLNTERKKKNKTKIFSKDHFKNINTYPFLQYKKPKLTQKTLPPDLGKIEEVYKALVLGIHDYVKKNGFERVVIGLSGGIDSSLTCVIAVDALGKENVIGISMPSAYTSQSSIEDAQNLAKNLGIEFYVVPIYEIFKVYENIFRKHFKTLREITLQNIQARIRGNILMAFSNNFGWMVLTTGNKSELSIGYCTLYGDTAGGFCVLKDVPKTLVYKLAKYRNKLAKKYLIPKRVLEKPPTAELKPNQTDEAEIGSYKILDKIMNLYVERNWDLEKILRKGFSKKVIKEIIYKIDKNEYKRRQSPPGIKITPRSFGKDRRMPITNRFSF